jgi:hypothetical protein
MNLFCPNYTDTTTYKPTAQMRQFNFFKGDPVIFEYSEVFATFETLKQAHKMYLAKVTRRNL